MVELSKVLSHAARREVHHKDFHEKWSSSKGISDSETTLEKVSLDYDPDEGKTPEERAELVSPTTALH